jgi:hypothetical protein
MQPLDITTYLVIVCFSQLCIADERSRQLHVFPEQTWRSPQLFDFAKLEDRSPVPFGLCILQILIHRLRPVRQLQVADGRLNLTHCGDTKSSMRRDGSCIKNVNSNGKIRYETA